MSLTNGAVSTNGSSTDIRFIPLSYDAADSHASALRLITTLLPSWASDTSTIDFVRFTGGVTNTLLQAVNRRAGLSKADIDHEAVLLRAYGQGTDVLIDRQWETQNHELLSKHGLAPELLARFENGMLYRFIRGNVTQPEDLRRPEIYRAVARRLAEWHAVVPCIYAPTGHRKKSSLNGSAILKLDGRRGSSNGDESDTNAAEREIQAAIDGVAKGKPSPNVWSVMQKWLLALPSETAEQKERQVGLQQELTSLVEQLSNRPGLGKNGVCTARSCQTSFADHGGSSSLRTVIC
jgi:ethanolamine kinase